jgi:hypothetical protein
VIKISPCVEYQPCGLCCEDHAHRNSPPLHKRTENYSKIFQFVLQQKQLCRTPVLEFFRHVNVGFRPRVEYQCWSLGNFTLADQKWEFLLLRAESYKFSSNSAVLSGFHQIDAMSFIPHIFLVDIVNKLANMWLMKISWISDGGTNSCFSQWLWCKQE